MSDSYLKCSCRVCGGHIEFPAHALGMSVGCPHCGGTTELYSAAPPPVAPAMVAPPPIPSRPQAPSSLVPAVPAGGARLSVSSAPPPAPPPPEPELEVAEAALPAQPVNWMGWSLSGVAILLCVVGGALYFNNASKGKSSIFPERAKLRAMAKGDKQSAQSDDDDNESAKTTNTTAAATAPKSIDDLKVSPIVLRKTSGSSLVYAIGTVRNESDQQRFGVTVELDLLDPAGKKIGTAKDYAKVIEPRKDWRFRALVVAPKTASAKLAKIREQE